MGFHIAADIGGTFTDFVVFNEETGTITSYKVPSTPGDPAVAVLNGLEGAFQRLQISPESFHKFVHGNTIGLNAILQGKGSRVALIVSEGFRDVLELGRLRLPDVVTLYPTRPQPLIPRRYVREIAGNIRANGQIEHELSLETVGTILKELGDAGIEAWGIALKNGYVNREHELKVKAEIGANLSSPYISVSSEIWPEIREYERTMITVLNAYVHPILDRYFTRLEHELRKKGMKASLYSTKSNGGVMTLSQAKHVPVETLLSGPASGAMGAAFIANLSEVPNCIGVDMGGTSTDVCMIRDGEVVYSTESKIGEYPMILPSVDISSIGAGGSSVVWIDDFGILKVGPESVGSDPGPACYGRGGSKATITDAYLIAGFLSPGHFAGGQIHLNPALSEQALFPLAEKMNKSVVELSWDILRVATANMATELQLLLAKRGLDRREFSILAYGGAGPTQAALLAGEVGIDHIVIPPSPGTLCALGALITDIRNDAIQSLLVELKKMDMNELRNSAEKLCEEASEWIYKESGVQDIGYILSLDMRYKGEPYDLEVLFPSEVDWDRPEELRGALGDMFHQTHQKVYNFYDSSVPIQIRNLRARAVGQVKKPTLPLLQDAMEGEVPTPRGAKNIYLGNWYTANIYNRTELWAGHRLQGPCIVEQDDTTTVIPLGFEAKVDSYGSLLLSRITESQQLIPSDERMKGVSLR